MRVLSYIALAFALFGALWWMPVRIDGRADINRIPTLHLDCAIWKLPLAYDAVVERREGSLALSIRRRGSKREPDQGVEAFVTTVKEIRAAVLFLRDHPRSLRCIRRSLRLQGLEVSVRAGMGDAAQTALLHGLCCVALRLLAQRMFAASQIRAGIRVQGDCREAAFLCSVRCIITFHVGNIIGAAMRIAMESIAHRRSR